MTVWQFPDAFFLLIVAAAIALPLAWVAWSRRSAPGARPIAALMLAIGIWCSVYALQHLINDLQFQYAATRLTYLGIAVVPTAWLVFVLEYTSGKFWHFRPGFLWLLIEPILVQLAIWTNSLHYLFYTRLEFVNYGSYQLLKVTHGPLFWIHAVYSYVLLLIGTIWLIVSLIRTNRYYQRQGVTVMIAAIIPWIGNVVYLMGFQPLGNMDLTPVLFTATGLLLTISLFRFQLFEAAPVARDRLVEVLSDGLVVVDAENRVVDINPAACEIIGCTAQSVIGMHGPDLIAKWPDLAKRYAGVQEIHEPFVVQNGSELKYYDLRITPLRRTDQTVIGRMFLLRDITGMVQVEQAMRSSEKRYRALVETSPDAIVLFDLEGQLILGNQPAARLHDLANLDTSIGKSVFDFVVPEEREDAIRIIDETKLANLQVNLEYTGLTRTGRRFPAEISISTLYDDQGHPQSFIGIIRDISVHKHVEEEIRRAAEAERAQRELSDALRSAVDVLNSSLDYETTLDQLLEQVARVLPYDSANIALIRDGFAYVSRTRGYEVYGAEIAEATKKISFDIEHTENFHHMYYNKTPMFVSDTETFPGWVKMDVTRYIRSWIGAPIIVQGEVVAFFSLDKKEPNCYKQEQTEILVSFANHAALALHNARLYTETRDLLEREKRLNEILQIIGRTLDLDTILHDIVRLGTDLVKADSAILSLVDETGEATVAPIAYRFPEGVIEERIPRGQGVVWELIESKKSLLIAHYSEHPKARPKLKKMGLHALLSVPVVSGDEILGGLAFFNFDPTKNFSERDMQLAEVLGRQAGITIQNARLFEDVRRRADEAETLRQATALVTSALDLDWVLDQIITNLERVVPFDSCAIFLREIDFLRIVAARGFPGPKNIVGETFPLNNELTLESISTNRVLILEDAQKDPRFEAWGDAKHIHGWMGVPLFARGSAIGYLTIDSHKVGAYRESDALMAQAFANEAAIAIENARLFAKVQHMAVTDPLTGLYNRRYFFELGHKEFSRIRRYGGRLSVIMLDVDGLKQANDLYGHLVGDQLIESIGFAIKKQMRGPDITARYAGDEFVALLPETTLQGALQVAQRLQTHVANNRILAGDVELSITISLGIAEIDRNCLSLEMLVNRADQALYASKQAGKNCISLWSSEGFETFRLDSAAL